MDKVLTIIYKSGAWMLGALLGYLEPTIHFAGICFFAIIIDCITAWRLSRRIKRLCPEAKNDGKFRSDKASKVFSTLFIVYSCVVLGYSIDVNICTAIDLGLANWIAGGFCFVQLWSILENESSANGASWAKLLQKIMIDKASRHVENIEEYLENLKNDKENENKQ